MKKLIFIAVISVMALALFAGCTQTTTEVVDKPDMDSSTEADTPAEADGDMDTNEDMDSKDDMDTSDSDEKDMDAEETVSGYMDISAEDAKALIESTPDIVIIDVSPKFAQGHLPGAVNYYVGDGSLDEAIPMLDKDKTYLVYCHVDSASIAGAQKLVDAGFENVYRLEGNYSAWVDAGYEVEM